MRVECSRLITVPFGDVKTLSAGAEDGIRAFLCGYYWYTIINSAAATPAKE